jgi:hypothetical protein
MFGQMRATWAVGDGVEKREVDVGRNEEGEGDEGNRRKGGMCNLASVLLQRIAEGKERTFSNMESSTSGEGAFFDVARTIPLVAAEKGKGQD